MSIHESTRHQIKNMKTLNALLFLSLAETTTTAYARNRETPHEIEKRYGDGKRY